MQRTKIVIIGLNNLKNPCSSTINSSIRKIDITGAISPDPGLINQTEKLRLNTKENTKIFENLLLKNKLIK